MNLSQKIEALLFWKAEPVALKKLASLLGADLADVKTAIAELDAALRGRGLSLVRTEDEVMLGTAKEAAPLIEQLTKDELARDLGKAGFETLSIVLYQGPISRADIDYIRGVNSQFILRALLVRGLVERVDNPGDARSFLYKATLDTLAHLGLGTLADLPEYEQVKRDIEAFKRSDTQAESQSTQSSPETNATIGE
ncbi:MAG: scpB [Candidatus Parcubacteria bacterium]|nr:scpB [Candidatus Parcubacteria bacterium]